MRRHFTFALYLLAAIALLLASFDSYAVRAPQGLVVFTQPDGTSFQGYILGDEFARVKLTSDGRPIIQDAQKWWCYASYDALGHISCSEVHVGDDYPIVEVPFETLAANASLKRQQAMRCASKTKAFRNPATKSGDKEWPSTINGLVIVVQYQDSELTIGKNISSFDNLLNLEGYSYGGAVGSAKDYFEDNFLDKVKFSFQVAGPYTLPHNVAYYGANDESGNDVLPEEMIIDACKLADGDINFAEYDTDGDGYVDNVFVFYAGLGEADGGSEDTIWPHKWHVYYGAGKKVELDGKILDEYACSSELVTKNTGLLTKYVFTGIGTFCHEFAHVLGLYDLYATESMGGLTNAAMWGITSLMDSGNYNSNGNCPPYFNAIDRYVLGLAKFTELSAGTFTLPSINQAHDVCFSYTDKDGEFYLFECRKPSGWDTYIQNEETNANGGMLIYHLDVSDNNSGSSTLYSLDNIPAYERWPYNIINGNYKHPCADLIEADGRTDAVQSIGEIYIKSFKGLFYPYGSKNTFSPSTSPAFTFWSGNSSSISLSNIAVSGNSVTFKVSGSTPVIGPSNVKSDVFQDAAIISWDDQAMIADSAILSFGLLKGRKQDFTVVKYEAGKFACTVEGLSPTTGYSYEVCLVKGGVKGKSVSGTFLTKSVSSGSGHPYIYLKSVERYSDGTCPVGTLLPLRVFNALDAKEISWTFDGKTISTDDNGYYSVTSSGLLEARISYKDGSVEILSKDIIVTTK